MILAPIPPEVLASLADFIHLVTRLKLVPEAAQDASLTPDESDSRGVQFSQALSMPVLDPDLAIVAEGPAGSEGFAAPARRRRHGSGANWLRRRSADPRRSAAQAESLRQATSRKPLPRGAESRRASAGGDLRRQRMAVLRARRRKTSTEPAITLARFEDVVALAGQHRDIQMKLALERDVRLVRFEQGQIEFSLAPGGFAAACPNARAAFAGMDRAPAGWSRSRTRQASRVSRSRKTPRRAKLCPACAPSLWCKACSPLSRAPKSSRSARPGPRRKKIQRLRRDAGTNDEIAFNDGIYGRRALSRHHLRVRDFVAI